MSGAPLKLAAFAAMSSEERAEALRHINSAAVIAEIRELEIRYEMTSTQALELSRRGELPDTADTARWLVLLKAVHFMVAK
jgi:hypothetical protein